MSGVCTGRVVTCTWLVRRGGTLHIDRLKSGDLEALDLNSLKRIPRHNVKAPGRQRYTSLKLNGTSLNVSKAYYVLLARCRYAPPYGSGACDVRMPRSIVLKFLEISKLSSADGPRATAHGSH